MMLPLATRARPVLFQGRHAVAALCFEPALYAQQSVLHAHILEQWRHGSALYDFGRFWILQWPQAQALNCQQLPGLALCLQDGLYVSAPMLAQESAQMQGAQFALLLGAAWLTLDKKDAKLLQAAQWLDCSALTLRRALTPPRATAAGPNVQTLIKQQEQQLQAKPIRQVLQNKVAPPSEERLEMQRLLQSGQSAPHSAPPAAVQPAAAKPAAATAAAPALGWGQRLLRFYLNWARQLRHKPEVSQAPHALPPPAAPDQPSEPSAFARALNQGANHLADASGLRALALSRQQRYIEELFKLFEQGDMAQALRHALPLQAGNREGLRALGVPKPRQTLQYTVGRGGGTTLVSSTDVFESLRSLYRKKALELEAAGQLDEAAYMLAELLQAPEEAVALLEKHGRLEQAADLALLLHLPPERAVYLLWRSGQRARALQIARLRGGAPAVLQILEQEGVKSQEARRDAQALRWAMARNLGQNGNLLEALRMLWPLQAQLQQTAANEDEGFSQSMLQAVQAQAALWLRQLPQHAAPLDEYPQLLMFELHWRPQALPDYLPRLQALLYAEGPQAASTRLNLAQALLTLESKSATCAMLAQQLCGPLLQDRVAGLNRWDKSDFKRLAGIAQNRLLHTQLLALELPPLLTTQSIFSYAGCFTHTQHERGSLSIHDVWRMQNGHYLVACGESGLRLLDAHGHVLSHFALPATRIVPATHERHALCLMPRGSQWRIGRLDLNQRLCQDWLQLPLQDCAREYDGEHWDVLLEQRFLSLDCQADTLQIAWSANDLPGEICGFGHSSNHVCLLLKVADAIHEWRYHWPARRPHSRLQYPLPQAEEQILLAPQSSDAHTLRLFMDGNRKPSLAMPDAVSFGKTQIIKDWRHANTPIERCGPWLLQSLPEAVQCAFVPASFHGAQYSACKILLHLPGAQACGQRLCGQHLLAFDECGRLLDLDLQSCTVQGLTLD